MGKPKYFPKGFPSFIGNDRRTKLLLACEQFFEKISWIFGNQFFGLNGE